MLNSNSKKVRKYYNNMFLISNSNSWKIMADVQNVNRFCSYIQIMKADFKIEVLSVKIVQILLKSLKKDKFNCQIIYVLNVTIKYLKLKRKIRFIIYVHFVIIIKQIMKMAVILKTNICLVLHVIILNASFLK